MLKRLAATATLLVFTPALGAVAQQDPANPEQARPGQEILPGQPGQDRPGQDLPGQDIPGQVRPGQDLPGQDRPGQDRPGQDSPSAKSSEQLKTPEEVLNKLHAENYKEIILSTMARLRSDDENVQQFAKEVVDAHENLDENVREIAKKQNINLEDPMDKMKKEGKSPGAEASKDQGKFSKKMEELQAMNREEFTREYTSMMAESHDELLNNLEQAEQSIEDEQVKGLIKETSPKLRQHQQRAEELSKKLSTPGAQAAAK